MRPYYLLEGREKPPDRWRDKTGGRPPLVRPSCSRRSVGRGRTVSVTRLTHDSESRPLWGSRWDCAYCVYYGDDLSGSSQGMGMQENMDEEQD